MKLTNEQTTLVDQSFALIAGLALLRHDSTDENSDLRKQVVVEAELRRAFAVIKPLTTKAERIQYRGRLSRADVARLEAAADPTSAPMSHELRQQVIALGSTYEFANQGEEEEAAQQDRFMTVMGRALRGERAAIADWLRANDHADLAEQVLAEAHRRR